MKKLWLAFILCLGLTPAQAQQIIPYTTNTIPIAGTIATATKIISAVDSRYIYITAINLVPAATSVITFTAGTGTNCGTNTVSLTGAMTFTAGETLTIGTGYGVVLAAPAGYDVCLAIGTATAPGFIAYSIF